MAPNDSNDDTYEAPAAYGPEAGNPDDTDGSGRIESDEQDDTDGLSLNEEGGAAPVSSDPGAPDPDPDPGGGGSPNSSEPSGGGDADTVSQPSPTEADSDPAADQQPADGPSFNEEGGAAPVSSDPGAPEPTPAEPTEPESEPTADLGRDQPPLDEDDTLPRPGVEDAPGALDTAETRRVGGEEVEVQDATPRELRARRQLMEQVQSEYPWASDDDVRLRREDGQLVAEFTDEGLAIARSEAGVGEADTPAVTPGRPGSPADPSTRAGRDTVRRELGERGPEPSPVEPGSPATDIDVDSNTESVTLEPTEEAPSRVGERPSSPAPPERREFSPFIDEGEGDPGPMPRDAEPGSPTREDFGDIPVRNPVTGNRLEVDLKNLEDQYRQQVTEPAAEQSLPVQAARVNDQIAASVAEAVGRDETAAVFKDADAANRRISRQAAPGVAFALQRIPGGEALATVDRARARNQAREQSSNEGFTEATTSGFVEGAVGVFNPGELALAGKEVVEFGVTQPGRVVDVGEAAEPGIDSAPRGAVSSQGALVRELDRRGIAEIDRRGAEGFSRDVEQRGAEAAAAAVQQGRRDPIGATGRFAGGLATGAAAGTAIGRATPLGSDISGRVLQASARGGRRVSARVRRAIRQGGFDDARAQGDLTRLVPERLTDDGETPLADAEELAEAEDALEQQARQRRIRIDERQQRRDELRPDDPEPDPDPQTVSREEFESVTGQENVRAAQSARNRGQGPQERRRQADRSSVADEDDLSPREAQLAEQLDTPEDDLREVLALEQRLEASPGQLGLTRSDLFSALGGIGAASLREQARAESAPRQDARTRVDSRADSRVDAATRTDLESRVDSRTGLETRLDIEQRIDSATRLDLLGRLDAKTRVDTETRVDPELRVDTPVRDGPGSRVEPPEPNPRNPDGGDDEDEPLDRIFEAEDEVFDTGVVQSLDELLDGSGF